MCFSGNIFQNKKKIATEDIVCYKIGKRIGTENFTPYFYSWYNYNKN